MIIDLDHRGFISDKIPEYTYTGVSEFIDDGNGSWRIKFTTSGILEFTAPNSAGDSDLFLVAGGEKGQQGSPQWPGQLYGGVGGRGGYGGECKTIKGVRLKRRRYQIDIGQADEDTKITDLSTGEAIALAKTGAGVKGGRGASYANVGGDGELGIPEFNEEGAKRYAGGGGGGYCPHNPGGWGEDGGGTGYTGDNDATGIGGGGGGGASYYDGFAPGGKGFQGILIIRKHKEAVA